MQCFGLLGPKHILELSWTSWWAHITTSSQLKLTFCFNVLHCRRSHCKVLKPLPLLSKRFQSPLPWPFLLKSISVFTSAQIILPVKPRYLENTSFTIRFPCWIIASVWCLVCVCSCRLNNFLETVRIRQNQKVSTMPTFCSKRKFQVFDLLNVEWNVAPEYFLGFSQRSSILALKFLPRICSSKMYGSPHKVYTPSLNYFIFINLHSPVGILLLLSVCMKWFYL